MLQLTPGHWALSEAAKGLPSHLCGFASAEHQQDEAVAILDEVLNAHVDEGHDDLDVQQRQHADAHVAIPRGAEIILVAPQQDVPARAEEDHFLAKSTYTYTRSQRSILTRAVSGNVYFQFHEGT